MDAGDLPEADAIRTELTHFKHAVEQARNLCTMTLAAMDDPALTMSTLINLYAELSETVTHAQQALGRAVALPLEPGELRDTLMKGPR